MKIDRRVLQVLMFFVLLGIWDSSFSHEEGAKGSIDDLLINREFWRFVAGCGAVSILVKIVDYVIHLNGSGVMPNNIKFKLGQWLLWFLSASIVGFLGNIVGLFQSSAQAAVMVGLGWPKVFAQLKEAYGPKTEATEAQAEAQAEGVFGDLSIGEEQVTSNECYDVDEEGGA